MHWRARGSVTGLSSTEEGGFWVGSGQTMAAFMHRWPRHRSERAPARSKTRHNQRAVIPSGGRRPESMGRVRSIPLGSPIGNPPAKPLRAAQNPAMDAIRQLRCRALRAGFLRFALDDDSYSLLELRIVVSRLGRGRFPDRTSSAI